MPNSKHAKINTSLNTADFRKNTEFCSNRWARKYHLCSTLSSTYASCQWRLSTPRTQASCRTPSPACSWSPSNIRHITAADLVDKQHFRWSRKRFKYSSIATMLTVTQTQVILVLQKYEPRHYHNGVIPCRINQRWEPNHLRFSHKNYHMHLSLIHIWRCRRRG